MGLINTWNQREYTSKGQVPEFVYERNDSQKEIIVSADLCKNESLLDLYIFNGNANDYNYLQMIKNFAFLKLQKHFNNQRDGNFKRLW